MKNEEFTFQKKQTHEKHKLLHTTQASVGSVCGQCRQKPREGKKKKNVFVYQTENKLLRHSGGVHLAGHLQTVETLHVANGFGQDLRRLHGGHLSAGLGQVAEPTEPRLGGDKHTCV